MCIRKLKWIVSFCLLSIAVGITTAVAQHPSQQSAEIRTKKQAETEYMRPLIQPDIAKYFRSDWLEGQYGLPKADQIVSMKAEIYQAIYGPDIDRFEVP